jgi:putative ABC transport system permease protein
MLALLRAVSWPTYRGTLGRLGLVLSGIALGVALIAGLDIINVSVLANFRTALERAAGRAALQVQLGTGEVGFPESVLQQVAADAGVEHANGMVRGTLHAPDRSGGALQLFGVDLVSDDAFDSYDVELVGTIDRLALVNDPDAVLLGEAYASRHGLRVGDRVRFATPTGIVSMHVRGVLRTAGLASVFGGDLAVMDLPTAQRLLGKRDRIDQIDVILRPDVAVKEVQGRLVAALPPSLSVVPPALRGERFENAIGAFQAILDGLSALCMLASIFIVGNTMATAVSERAQELAILRTLGADRQRIERLVLAEAALFGLFASAIGIVLGVALARILTSLVTQSMGMIYQVRVPAGGLTLSAGRTAFYMALGTFGAVIAAWVPARQAGRLDPIQLLRTGYRERVAAGSPDWLWLALGLLMIVASAVAVSIEDANRSVVWGNVAASLWWLAGLLLAVPAMSLLSKRLERYLPAMAGLPGHIAASGLRRAPARTGVTVAVIGLSLTLAVGLASVANSFQQSFRNWFTLVGDLVVSAVGTEGGWLESPLPVATADELRQIDGVAHVETYRALQGQPFRDARIAIVAVSPGFIDTKQFRAAIVAGDAEDAVHAIVENRAVLVSDNLAVRFGLRPGDEITVPAPTGPAPLRIEAVVTADFSGDQGSILMNRDRFTALWAGDDAVNHFNVFLSPGTDTAVVSEAIKERLRDRYLINVRTLSEALRYHQDMIDKAFQFTAAIQLLVIAVTLAGIADLLTTQIIERRREIALFEVLGAEQATIARAVWLEALLLGLCGAALGALISIGTSFLWVRITFRLLIGYIVVHHFALARAIESIALAGAVAFLAGWLAARRALRLPVLDALRYE